MVITYPRITRAHLPRTITMGRDRLVEPSRWALSARGNHVKAMLPPPLQSMNNVGIRGICTRFGDLCKTLCRKN